MGMKVHENNDYLRLRAATERGASGTTGGAWEATRHEAAPPEVSLTALHRCLSQRSAEK